MSNAKTKQIFKLMLASVLVLSFTGCGKPVSKDESGKGETSKAAEPAESAPKIYQEGVDAYQAGKFDVAAQKFKILADQGDASAQFNMGSLYHQGQGVTKDDKQAAIWFAKAAGQWHTDAMDNLGLRYAKGEGVEQDWVQAYKWFSIAGMSKNAAAASNAQVAASKMSPEQLQQAQAAAKEWMEEHPKPQAQSKPQ